MGAAAPEPVGSKYFRAAGSTLPFSEAVRAGNLIFVSGQIGTLPDGSVPTEFGVQARIAMDRIAAVLGRAGSSMDDVVKCLIMLTDMSRWSEFNRIYVGYFKPERMPARSALGATALAFGASIEVECIAALPEAPPPSAATADDSIPARPGPAATTMSKSPGITRANVQREPRRPAYSRTVQACLKGRAAGG
ncbi:MAG: RidA family protein [Gammaproteobacteria bacterium]|nr:RidA family protein [Gammaproteobacteria bacterium]